MRHVSPRMPLLAAWIARPHAAVLAAMSRLLDAQPALAAAVQQDLEAGRPTNARTEPPGLTGEQTLRFLLVRQLTGAPTDGLDLHRIGVPPRGLADISGLLPGGGAGGPPSKPALTATLRRVRPTTLAALNTQPVTSPTARAIERAQTVRMDATVVPVAIHPPTDSSLLLDAVRVLDPGLRQSEAVAGFIAYHRHLRRAKRRAVEIPHLPLHAGPRRRQCYRQLLQYTAATASTVSPRPGRASTSSAIASLSTAASADA